MKTSALKMQKPLNAADIFYLPKNVINNPKGVKK